MPTGFQQAELHLDTGGAAAAVGPRLSRRRPAERRSGSRGSRGEGAEQAQERCWVSGGFLSQARFPLFCLQSAWVFKRSLRARGSHFRFLEDC